MTSSSPNINKTMYADFCDRFNPVTKYVDWIVVNAVKNNRF